MSGLNQAPEATDKNKFVAALTAIVFVVFGVVLAYLSLHSVFSIIFHSIKLMVEGWLACSLLLGAPVVWGARNRKLSVRDYGSILIAPIGIFLLAYKGATKISHRRDRHQVNA